ncbi:maleylpyruvate isomerase family mycothiol-dependent enzyme [Streptomyces sp. TG1A-8]|uniref:maleylpyruvate isomerase family mycothiol-dependent enzyme n=1 Tax=Streptomyces sp. TG1A-8 TaxID=3051385 RepID=UPI00265C3514|nr:maleylpyruvate isomerase family mycothiol-dependent enzyme [Streptomyces sp. TG1A-8]MDO0928985.1 maleylpyruvate isomerase family mycothiol-dependent enzyme [Streptomyces sp. TG1A-8]
METAEHLQTLDREGRLLAAAAEAAGPDAEVPDCPKWRVRDLLRHTGAVHEWATGFVTGGHTAPRPVADNPDLDGAELASWYRKSHRELVDALAPTEPECWTFHPAPYPSPLAFWTRRQAHETTVHRRDAEAARGGAVSPVAADLSADGVDELLRGFHARPRSRVRTERPRTLRVRAVDAGGDAVWTVRLSAESPVASRDAPGEADTELSGPARPLYLALWNGGPVPQVTGDPGVAALWRERSGV